MVKFGQHSISMKFALLNNNTQQSSMNEQSLFISIVDKNRIEVVPYSYENERLVCSSSSTSNFLSNVNDNYEYIVLYNSTECFEKQRYYRTEKDSHSSIDKRKSYCNTHSTVKFTIDFTKYEKKEFEIGCILLFLIITTALVTFTLYKR